MNREQKIKFIRQSRFLEYAYAKLENYSDGELDHIIKKITDDLQKTEATVEDNRLTNFYIYLN